MGPSALIANKTYSDTRGRLSREKAQAIGETFEALRARHGLITPEIIVQEAKKKESILHSYFQWDDKVAAHRFRIEQARSLLQEITLEIKPGEYTRAFVNLSIDDELETPGRQYVPIHDVLESRNLKEQLLETAYAELKFFRHKYAYLEELLKVHKVIDEVINSRQRIARPILAGPSKARLRKALAA